MDECLMDAVLEKIYYCEGSNLLEMLFYLTRISKINYNFSGRHFSETFFAASDFLGKKLQKLREKAKIANNTVQFLKAARFSVTAKE